MRSLRRIWKNNDKILLFIRRKIDSFYANNNLEIGGVAFTVAILIKFKRPCARIIDYPDRSK